MVMFGSDYGGGVGNHDDCPSWDEVSSLRERNGRYRKAVELLLEVMKVQETRETGEAHLSAEAFRPVWDEAKSVARKVLDGGR